MVIADVMKRPVHTTAPAETASCAAKRMRDGGVGFLPVVDAAGNLLGAITERDIAWRLVADELAPSTPVSAIMQHSPATCRARGDLFEAQRVMRESHVRRVVCLDDDGLVAGVVTIWDVARHEDGLRLAKTVREAFPPETARRGPS
jgi:CBS domain-containing protein